MALQPEIDAYAARLKRLIAEAESSAYQVSRDKSEADFYQGIGGKLAPWMKFVPAGGVVERFMHGGQRILHSTKGRR